MTNLAETVGGHVRDYRRSLGYSQTQLVELWRETTIDQSRLSHIEAGKLDLRLSSLLLLSRLTGIEPDALLRP